MRFRLDRRWATLVVAVVLGAVGGSVLGFVTAPGPSGDARELAPVQEAAAPTTRRPRGRVAGISSTIRPRPRAQPAASPLTARPTTTTRRPTTTTLEPTTTSGSTTTTVGQDTTSSTSSTLPTSSTTSTT